MATFRLTRKAREDLKSIARYTQKTWGVSQRNKYLTQLDKPYLVGDARPLEWRCGGMLNRRLASNRCRVDATSSRRR